MSTYLRTERVVLGDASLIVSLLTSNRDLVPEYWINLLCVLFNGKSLCSKTQLGIDEKWPKIKHDPLAKLFVISSPLG